jgi:hypothetical protein
MMTRAIHSQTHFLTHRMHAQHPRLGETRPQPSHRQQTPKPRLLEMMVAGERRVPLLARPAVLFEIEALLVT